MTVKDLWTYLRKHKFDASGKKSILKEKVLNIMHDDNISKVDSDKNEVSNTDTDNSNESTYVSRSETESDTDESEEAEGFTNDSDSASVQIRSESSSDSDDNNDSANCNCILKSTFDPYGEDTMERVRQSKVSYRERLKRKRELKVQSENNKICQANQTVVETLKCSNLFCYPVIEEATKSWCLCDPYITNNLLERHITQ